MKSTSIKRGVIAVSEPWPWIVGLLVGIFIVIYEHLTDSKIFFKVFAFVAFIGALIVEGPMWGRAILVLMALGAFLADAQGVRRGKW